MTHPLALRLWPAHLAGLICVSAASGLGVWQYDAWQARRDAEATDLTHAKPVPLTDVMGSDDPFPGGDVGRPVEVAGTWVPAATVYISDREREGRTGYWVVTPVAVGGGDRPAVPVVRGWIPDLDAAPAPPQGEVDLTGLLQPAEGTGAVDDDPDDDVLPQLRIADLIQHIDQDLYGAYVVDDEPARGTEKVSAEQLPKVDTFTGLRNILYAFEWWIFALFALYVWLRHVREETRPADERDHQDGPHDSGSTQAPVPSGT